MSAARDVFCFAVPSTIALAVALSVQILVGGCGWPISSNTSRVLHASWQLKCSAASSGSATDLRTIFMIALRVWSGPF